MISGATESSYKFLFEHLKVPEDVEIDHIPNRLIQSNKPIKILWAHSNIDQPMYLGTDWGKITHVVCVSKWEKEQFLKYSPVPESKITVIRNGVADYFYTGKKEKTLIYASTPFRGLEYLPYIFTRVLEKHPDAKLKVFSAMNLYGLEDSIEQKKLYKELMSLPNTEYSPAISHTELADEFAKAYIFAYPNTWEETFCVALAEAMISGCIPVISDIGALPETSMGFGEIVKMTGKNSPSGWIPDRIFLDNFANKIIWVLDKYKYNSSKENSFKEYYSWESISKEWLQLLNKLTNKANTMTKASISTLVNETGSDIAADAKVLKKVYDEVFKWEEYDKEHAQGRSNFQIEKFIALDNFTIASSFNALLKNRRIMAEGLFSKVTEMKEKQREFEYKWKDKPKNDPIEWFDNQGNKKLCWYDLDSMNLENFLKSSELEIRDRVQQIEFFDKLLNKLIEMNGGPITREQFEKEDHIYWERRFANQAFDEMVSHKTGISIGNIHSMRRGTAPTLVSDDVNRIKNGYPDLGKALLGDPSELLLGLQEKVMQGIEEVTGTSLALGNESITQRLDNMHSDQVKPSFGSDGQQSTMSPKTVQQSIPSPKKLFNSEYKK
jgi:hypothetical protein